MVLLTILGIIGTVENIAASPDPCPDSGDAWNNKPTSNAVLVLQEDLGNNLIKYYAKSATDKSPSSGIPGFREVCVYSSIGATSANSLWSYWGVKKITPHIEFRGEEGGGDKENIPFDGNIHAVGTIQWNAVPQNIRTLVHVKSAELCPGEPDESCFLQPPNPPGVVPELSTMILTLTGIIGLVMTSRKYRKN